ncbi:MAG TPA: hypothetical protein VIV12_28770, partial [Streptosporangiaceae bacterium]
MALHGKLGRPWGGSPGTEQPLGRGSVLYQGRLSSNGKFTSSPAQIERAFQHMQRWHELWLDQEPDSKRHVVLYAHGGLNSEEHALS